ncbi:MAG: TlpA family protein disulfide reductase [Marinifilaceae bacterium]
MKHKLLLLLLLLTIVGSNSTPCVAQEQSSAAKKSYWKDVNGNWISEDEFNLHFYLGKYDTNIPDYKKNRKAWKELKRFWRKHPEESGVRHLVALSDEGKKAKIAEIASQILVKDHLGQEFASFQVVDLNGKPYNSEELKGKVVVLNFWFLQCLPCQLEVAALNQLVQKYRENPDVVFISFAHNKKEDLVSHPKTQKLLYPTVVLNKELGLKFKLQSFPTNIVIDRTGKYAFESRGARFGSVGLLDQAIVAALK